MLHISLYVPHAEKIFFRDFRPGPTQTGEAWWPSGRASDSGARGWGFDPHSGLRVVSLSKIHLPPQKVLVIPRKRWLRFDMTEKLLTGT